MQVYGLKILESFHDTTTDKWCVILSFHKQLIWYPAVKINYCTQSYMAGSNMSSINILHLQNCS